MRKFDFKEAEWEVTHFLNVPISTGALSNQTGQDLHVPDEYDFGSDEGGEGGGF